MPQTQCGQCGYAGCKPYAIAIANGTADINQCPPGDESGIYALAKLLNVSYKPLNKAHGEPKPKAVAFIDETVCIGCTLCIKACPVDAILGASKQMHTVIASECTGCELCIAPCPVDCINMQSIAEILNISPIPSKQPYHHAKNKIYTEKNAKDAAKIARKRHEFRLIRIERQQLEQATKHAKRKLTAKDEINIMKRQLAIASALSRASIHNRYDAKPSDDEKLKN